MANDQDPLRAVDRIPGLVQGLLKLADMLSREDRFKESAPAILTLTAEFLTNAHAFITTAHDIMERAKIAALFDSYRECGVFLRTLASDMEGGRKVALSPSAALRQAATAMEAAADGEKRVMEPGQKKPKLLMN